jgi:hypothetical protein
MKTKIVCPNKNDPAWKTLVEAIGEDLAYLSFFRNDDVIPDVATARTILGLKEPVEAAKPPVAPASRPAVLAPKQTPSKSKKPRVTTPKKAPQFHGVVLSKIERTNLAMLSGQTQHRGGIFLYRSRPNRQRREIPTPSAP